MLDNANTEKHGGSVFSSTLEQLRNIQKLAIDLDCTGRVAIHTFECSEPYASTPKGQIWVQTLLVSHPNRIRRELGVRKKLFGHLVQELTAVGHAPCEGVMLEEQLAIFLYTCTTGLPCRHVAERFDRPIAVIKKCFCKMLEAIASPPIYTKYVKLPRGDDPTPAYIANDPILHPFFKDAIGAMDGMHVLCASRRYPYLDRNRMGFCSHYSLVCCTFNLEFTFIFTEPGMDPEDVYCDARLQGLRVPVGKYYIADVALPACPQVLVPYTTQHRPRGWQREEMRSGTNAHDYFNQRHAQLKSVVERAIYFVKQRFRILTVVTPEYDEEDHHRFPAALCCIHNIIRYVDPEDVEKGPIAFRSGLSSIARSGQRRKTRSPEVYGPLGSSWWFVGDDSEMMVEKREEIASGLWKDRLCQYPRSQDRDFQLTIKSRVSPW